MGRYFQSRLTRGTFSAANRDPRRYNEPDRLEIARRAFAPLSCGSGPHVCIGAALTLIEAEVALYRILQRWPGLQLCEGRPQWNRNPLYRGLSTLRVHDRANVRRAH